MGGDFAVGVLSLRVVNAPALVTVWSAGVAAARLSPALQQVNAVINWCSSPAPGASTTAAQQRHASFSRSSERRDTASVIKP